MNKSESTRCRTEAVLLNHTQHCENKKCQKHQHISRLSSSVNRFCQAFHLTETAENNSSGPPFTCNPLSAHNSRLFCYLFARRHKQQSQHETLLLWHCSN